MEIIEQRQTNAATACGTAVLCHALPPYDLHLPSQLDKTPPAKSAAFALLDVTLKQRPVTDWSPYHLAFFHISTQEKREYIQFPTPPPQTARSMSFLGIDLVRNVNQDVEILLPEFKAIIPCVNLSFDSFLDHSNLPGSR